MIDTIYFNIIKCDQEYNIGNNGIIVAKLFIDKNKKSFTVKSLINALIYQGEYNNTQAAIDISRKIISEYLEKPKTIWINTWFSSIESVILDLKKSLHNIIIIGTHKDNECTYRNSVDVFYTEPFGCLSKEYLNFAYDFCKKNHIDVVLPKSYALTLQRNRQLFNDIGVGIIAEDSENIALCRSKDAVYKKLKSFGYNKIPEYRIVKSLSEFIEAYKKLGNENICFKYDSDEGAMSFRRVTNSFLNYRSLDNLLENTISYNDAIAILNDAESKNKFKPLMVMPILSGPEVSVDCYNSPNMGFIAIPRYKLGSRIKKITFNDEIIKDAQRIGKLLNLQSAYNVQYRWGENNQLLLLEVNTRMSGGVHMSSLCGISIPNQIIGDSLGYKVKQSIPEECTVTQYEQAILIE